LTPWFNSSNLPTKIGRTFTDTREKLWPYALPASPVTRMGTAGVELVCWLLLVEKLKLRAKITSKNYNN